MSTSDANFPAAPFELRANYARNERLKASGLALLMLVFGLGMGTCGFYVTAELLRVHDIANHGILAESDVGYTGEVKTHKAFLKDYDLKVTFTAQGRQEPTEFRAEFFRFFTGPSDGDAIGVKYLKDNPSQAVTTWQIDARTHGWIWCLLLLGMGVGGCAFAVISVRRGFGTVEKVQDLARNGKLLLAGVESATQSSPNGQPMLELKYRMPRGETEKQTFVLKDGAPHFDAEQRLVLVLCSLDERRSHALRADGFPLARVPTFQA